MFENNKISTVRTVSDKSSNNYGYKLIIFCKRNNWYILNGRLGEDKLYGNTTCRNSSCIDYFISNVNMFEYSHTLFVDNFCPLLSDVHNPILFKMRLKTAAFETPLSAEEEILKDKLWDRNFPDQFVDSIDVLKLCEIESKLDNFIENKSFEQINIDLIVQDLANLFIESSRKAYGTQSENSEYTQLKSILKRE